MEKEAAYIWRMIVPTTGEILESSTKSKSTDEAVKAASQYASRNMEQDTCITVQTIDDQDKWH